MMKRRGFLAMLAGAAALPKLAEAEAAQAQAAADGPAMTVVRNWGVQDGGITIAVDDDARPYGGGWMRTSQGDYFSRDGKVFFYPIEYR